MVNYRDNWRQYWECKTCCYGVTSSDPIPRKVTDHEYQTGHVMDVVSDGGEDSELFRG